MYECRRKSTQRLFVKERAEDFIKLAQYENLRTRFSNMISEVLGVNYYNDAYDVYESDKRCCEAVVDRFESLELKYKFWKGVGRCTTGCSIILLVILILSQLI